MRLPAIVNLDGFYLSFTREPVEIPDAGAADAFLPAFEPGSIRFRASAPASQAVAVLGGSPYSYFRYETHLAARNALAAYDDAARDFNAAFGRQHDAVESYHAGDAEIVFVARLVRHQSQGRRGPDASWRSRRRPLAAAPAAAVSG